MQNEDIRNIATKSGVRLWEIADALGMTEWTLSRKLRKELNDEQKERIYSAIEVIKAQRRSC